MYVPIVVEQSERGERSYDILLSLIKGSHYLPRWSYR